MHSFLRMIIKVRYNKWYRVGVERERENKGSDSVCVRERGVRRLKERERESGGG